MPQVEYIGIDIDPVVIQFAQQAFSDLPNFYFVCGDLTELQMPAKKFDFILFAGVCHHIDDKLCKKMLQTAQNLLSENGSLVVIDILQPEPEDSWLVRQYIKIDQGEHIRSDAEL
ncbi:MAG TPA: class I SAM-dependent methyltransferase, partial [Planctomycetaceae bacterium]|nr:class I SAM-dependent methyltransferase [Planctomycetaceae bacterium]